MRNKIIGYSIACCFVLGVMYLKNKVFALTINSSEENPEEETM